MCKIVRNAALVRALLLTAPFTIVVAP